MTTASKTWLAEERKDVAFKGIAFLISPVLGLLAALPRLNTRSSFLVFLLSMTLFGLTMIVPSDRSEQQNFDCIEYRMRFEKAVSFDTNDMSAFLRDYADNEGSTDIYDRLLCFLVTRFSSNYHVFFMVVAFIYTVFMLKSLRYLVSDANYRFSALCLCLLFLFTVSQVYMASVVRFFTAFWIALYALFRVFVDHRKEALLWLVLTPFIHASFVILWVVLAIYWIVRGRNRGAVILIIAGILFSAVALQLFALLLPWIPGNIGEHYSEYLDQWYVQYINESGTGYKWVVRLMELAVRLSVNGMVLYMAWHYKERIAGTSGRNVYFLLCAFLIFVNFTFMVPAVGSRYVMFLFPLIAYVWLVCFSGNRFFDGVLYAFAGLYLFYFFVLPWNIYLLPCLRSYAALWNADILCMSPLYLLPHYLF